ncbi:MAG: hypothetical protein WC460_03390 [Patescibacteria group bacterium]
MISSSLYDGNFKEECQKRGLDPQKTSFLMLGCIQNKLDPNTTSIFKLQCVRFGLNPEVATLEDLRRLGAIKK